MPLRGSVKIGCGEAEHHSARIEILLVFAMTHCERVLQGALNTDLSYCVTWEGGTGALKVPPRLGDVMRVSALLHYTVHWK
jgi:hypothetical protein